MDLNVFFGVVSTRKLVQKLISFANDLDSEQITYPLINSELFAKLQTTLFEVENEGYLLILEEDIPSDELETRVANFVDIFQNEKIIFNYLEARDNLDVSLIRTLNKNDNQHAIAFGPSLVADNYALTKTEACGIKEIFSENGVNAKLLSPFSLIKNEYCVDS